MENSPTARFGVNAASLSTLFLAVLLAIFMLSGDSHAICPSCQCRARVAPRRPYPDAYGFGAKAQVGLAAGSYTVYSVSNANDSGSGSARACLEATGNRICVVKTGGTVVLASPIVISSGSVYFAGQKAPNGFQFTTGGTFAHDNRYVKHVRVNGDDVVIRNVRFRHSNPPTCVGGSYNDCHLEMSLEIYNTADRVLIDQISSSWASEDAINIGFTMEGVGPYDTTFQRSIVGQPIAWEFPDWGEFGHAMNTYGNRFTLTRNFIASGMRQPGSTGGGEHEFINNVAYTLANNQSWSFITADCERTTDGVPTKSHVIGNSYEKATGASQSSPPFVINKNRNCNIDGCDGLSAYISGNRSWKDPDASNAQTAHYSCRHSGKAAQVPEDYGCSIDPGASNQTYDDCASQTQYTSTQPLFASYAEPPPTAITAATALDIVAESGAVPRDVIDDCIVSLYTSRTGSQITTAAAGCNGGVPASFAAGTWCGGDGGDTDADSMCDGWETQEFGDLTHTGADDTDADGWSDLEEFLNSTTP